MMRNLIWLALILILNTSLLTDVPENRYVATSTVIPTVTATRIFKGQGRISTYLRNYYTYAVQIEKEENIPSMLILSVAALESNWDRSLLSSNYNNYFGRKATGNEKRCVLKTLEFRNGAYQTEYANFKAYSNAKQSFRDFARLLNSNKRYKALKNLELKDFKSWARELHKAGYATDPYYSTKLIKVSNLLKSKIP